MSARAWILLALAVAWWAHTGSGLNAIVGADTGAGPVEDVPYAAEFNRAGTTHGVDPNLLAAVARVESNYQPDAVSPAGAQGLMQFMPATANSMDVDPWNPTSAIDGAARYLANSHRIHGNWPDAIAAYNAGDPAVTRRGRHAAEARLRRRRPHPLETTHHWRHQTMNHRATPVAGPGPDHRLGPPPPPHPRRQHRPLRRHRQHPRRARRPGTAVEATFGITNWISIPAALLTIGWAGDQIDIASINHYSTTASPPSEADDG